MGAHLSAELQAAISASDFRFRLGQTWTQAEQARFDAELLAQVARAGQSIPHHLMPVARFAYLVASWRNFAGGADAATWIASLANDVLADGGISPPDDRWVFPSGTKHRTLGALLRMRVRADVNVLTPRVCALLMDGLTADYMGQAHADLRQDGLSDALLWLDAVCVRAAEVPESKVDASRVVDTLWTHNMAMESAFSFVAKPSGRGFSARRLIARLARRAIDADAPAFGPAKPGNKLADELWPRRPFKHLADNLVTSATVSSLQTAGDLASTLRDLSAIAGVDVHTGATSFGYYLCLAIQQASCSLTWSDASRRLACDTKLIQVAVGCLVEFGCADAEFLDTLRDAFVRRKPHASASVAVETFLNELTMLLHIAASTAAADQTTATAAPRRRRANI